MNMNKVLLLVLLMFASLNILSAGRIDLEIDYFYTTNCPACGLTTPFLEEMVNKYEIVLNKYEITRPENSNLFRQKLDEYDVSQDRRGYVPTVFIGEDYFVGHNPQGIENKIIELMEINGETNHTIINENEKDSFIGDATKVETKILGVIPVDFNLSGDNFINLFFSTIILGVLDSLNICSITVLMFLIIYLLSIGTVKRVLKTGTIFIAVIYLFYFLFVLFLSSLISMFILEYGIYIRSIVVFFSLVAGVLLVKDYFFYGKGISLAVPQSAKPILEKYMKQATVVSTIIFALLASLVELPCTAVFPMIYSTILAENMVVGIERIAWVALYNLIYVIPLIVLVLGTYFSWINVDKMDEKIQKNKKKLKLISGILLLIIALYFVLPLVS